MTDPAVESDPSNERLGRLSTSAEATQGFLATALDPATGHLRLDKRGRLWEAVSVAHTMGATGRDRCVAVIDVGFDTSLTALSTDLHPDSVVRPDSDGSTGGHGTVVALLVREVAPDAELLLLDVSTRGPLRIEDVAKAVTTAAAAHADVINLSLEFPTDCPLRDYQWIDPGLATETVPESAKFLAEVNAWIANSEPYAGSRCASRCALCDALATLPPSTLVVAASGNDDQNACPACFENVLGAAFSKTRRVEANGVVITTAELPASTAPFWRAEVWVEEPPGFLGTSFASPLLAGFWALLPEPTALSPLARMSKALFPVQMLLSNQLRAAPAGLPEGAPLLVHQGLIRLAEALPPAHKHFDQDLVADPCPACTLLVIDWYDTFVSLLVHTGRPVEALGIARIAVVLAPAIPGVHGNRALAAKQAAEEAAGDAAASLWEESHASYERAAELAPDIDMYRTAADHTSGRAAG